MIEIIVDVREHSLIDKFQTLMVPESKISMKTTPLLLGDVLFQMKYCGDSTSSSSPNIELLLFERKTLTDLLASIRDGRYEEQSHRIVHTSGLHSHNIVYIIEGALSTLRSPADKKIVLSAITSLSYFKGFSVIRTSTVLETAELIWAMANKMQKEFDMGTPIPSHYSVPPTQQSSELEPPSAYGNFVKKVKRDNITPENISEILLSQIPGISNNIAAEILKHFDGSFCKLIEGIKNSPEKLDAIQLESSKGDGKRRKLSKTVIQSILRFLREDDKIKDMVVVDHKSEESERL